MKHARAVRFHDSRRPGLLMKCDIDAATASQTENHFIGCSTADSVMLISRRREIRKLDKRYSRIELLPAARF